MPGCTPGQEVGTQSALFISCSTRWAYYSSSDDKTSEEVFEIMSLLAGLNMGSKLPQCCISHVSDQEAGAYVVQDVLLVLSENCVCFQLLAMPKGHVVRQRPQTQPCLLQHSDRAYTMVS